ncbi:hypothetical protein BDR05DRAFT_630745 [Suillus weaverae]|nr:hypothetical protein BDR05DRAFT_630745 [Suillus weaverae]
MSCRTLLTPKLLRWWQRAALYFFKAVPASIGGFSGELCVGLFMTAQLGERGCQSSAACLCGPDRPRTVPHSTMCLGEHNDLPVHLFLNHITQQKRHQQKFYIFHFLRANHKSVMDATQPTPNSSY